jgi:hypothetical protein
MLPFGEVDGVSGFHERTLRKWVRAGKLVAVRKVGQCLGHPAELGGWLEAEKGGQFGRYGRNNSGPDFVRLANSLSALYPKDSEEMRLLDAMLLPVPRVDRQQVGAGHESFLRLWGK